MTCDALFLTIIVTIIATLIVNQFTDTLPWAARKIVIFSARRVGNTQAAKRYEEEWLGTLDDVPGGLAKLVYALSILIWATIPLRAELGRHAARPHPWYDLSSALRIALARPRIMLALALVASVRFADDAVLALGSQLAHMLTVPSAWRNYFLAAFGFGVVLAAVVSIRLRTRRRRKWPAYRWCHAAAWSVLLSGMSVCIFGMGYSTWISLTAALLAGIATLRAATATLAALAQVAGRSYAGQMIALWAIALAGSQPIAFLQNRWLSTTTGMRDAALVAMMPAVVIALMELFLSPTVKKMIKAETFAFRQHK